MDHRTGVMVIIIHRSKASLLLHATLTDATYETLPPPHCGDVTIVMNNMNKR